MMCSWRAVGGGGRDGLLCSVQSLEGDGGSSSFITWLSRLAWASISSQQVVGSGVGGEVEDPLGGFNRLT